MKIAINNYATNIVSQKSVLCIYRFYKLKPADKVKKKVKT